MTSLAERVIANAEEYEREIRPANYRERDKGSFRVSWLGLCAKQQGYAYLNTKEDRLPQVGTRLMSLGDGHVQEEEIANRILKTPGIELVRQNYPHRKKYRLKDGTELFLYGTPDLEIMDDGEPYIIEIKALQETAYSETERTGEPPSQYVTQLHGYLLLCEVKKGVLYIKNRNSSEVMSFEYELTPEKKIEILKRQFKIQKLVNQEKLPEREFQIGSRECFYCPYSKQCWPGEDFKGYIHGKTHGVHVDLDDEPAAKNQFLTAVKMYDRANKEVKRAEDEIRIAKEQIELLLKEYKADGVEAGGYSAKTVTSTRYIPDKVLVAALVKEGKITQKEVVSSYIRVDLPKALKEKAE